MTAYPWSCIRIGPLPWVVILLGNLVLGGLLTHSSAQVHSAIRPDSSVGTTVTSNGAVHTIADGTRRGGNLFHSFDQFTVGTGDTARFTGPPSGIENILSRVTGGQPSTIDGRLQSDMPGANLFFLNPSGILFGPHAQLDVQGSVHVSTADVLRFADGTTWSVNLSAQSTLTTATPAAFGFLRPNPQGITIRESVLEVPANEALSVIGGDIDITGGPDGFVIAPSGHIQLVSVASPSNVILHTSDQAPGLTVDAAGRLGAITLSDLAVMDVRGEDGGGTVVIRGGRLLVDNSCILADTLGDRDGAPLGIDIMITQDIRIQNDTLIRATAFGAGDAGDIQITAGTLTLGNESFILSATFVSGDAGAVTVTADTLALDNTSTIGSGTFGGGDASAVTVTAGTLSLDNQSRIFSNTCGNGDAGTITVTADTLTLDNSGISSPTFGSGNAGAVTVTADTLTLDNQSLIGSATFGSGDAGTVTVTAGALTLDDGLINSVTFNSGDAGTVTITAGVLPLDNTSGISSDHLPRDNTSGISSGDAGTVTVTADTLTLDNNRVVPQ